MVDGVDETRNLVMKAFRLSLQHTTCFDSTVHGPGHWFKVERNARYLCNEERIDDRIPRLFAVIHDIMREHDGFDKEHGPKASRFVEDIAGSVLGLNPGDIALLSLACRDHTTVKETTNDVIGLCWDADRLDIGRVGIVPDPAFMTSRSAKAMAARANFEPLLSVKMMKELGECLD